MSGIVKATKDGTAVVTVAGIPIPTPRRNEGAVRGGAIGGGLGALAGAFLALTPFGLAVCAGLAAAAGAAIGADADKGRRT